MSVILILIIFSLLVAIIFLGAFFWAVKSGQYDDQYTPSIRMLFDNKKDKKEQNNNSTN
ncbi:MAG: cbb3-type cytochrome oxidase assembly protein CcoS [Melioribacteraceae bacterium]|jgi:cbb3-type cytochrome oxidase maturation protein|nr:cbb3-type cytochrome oxidase assembly protein CcoS [Ignavibacteriota bacterium]MBZ0180991.1 cbb3-type cytochrome oxidase assembly protein CcoS [Melioribacteraceae bacterium]|tara:strand:- start:503 stop:679 length:177 start_codon:yes stop_codon:yes gene_type:complete